MTADTSAVPTVPGDCEGDRDGGGTRRSRTVDVWLTIGCSESDCLSDEDDVDASG